MISFTFFWLELSHICPNLTFKKDTATRPWKKWFPLIWLNLLYVTCLGILNKCFNEHKAQNSMGSKIRPAEVSMMGCPLRYLLRMPRHVTYKKFSHINGNDSFKQSKWPIGLLPYYTDLCGSYRGTH